MKNRCSLFVNMLAKGVLGFLLMGLLLFGGAGTLRYPGAWLFLGAMLALMLTMGLLLLAKAPETLARRLKTREQEPAQKWYVAATGVVFLASFVLAGLSFRFGWAQVPFWGSLVALGVMAAGYGLYAAVMFQNAYASRVVEVQEGQTLISTGLYGVVRHPMYLAALVLFGAMPVVLGSWLALLPMAALPITLGVRIKNEEAVLAAGLAGYPAYMKKVRYRLIPFVW